MAHEDRETTMMFCSECNNLLYPKEVQNHDDPSASKLVYVCRAPLCQESSKPRDQMKEASPLVWKHVVKHTMKYGTPPLRFEWSLHADDTHARSLLPGPTIS